MSATDILIVGGLAVLVVALLRASEILSKNPHQQLKAHEDLAGQFPANMSTSEKFRLINLFGLSPSNPIRPWLLVIAVVVLFLFVAWLQ
jgi:hypothetical protein